MAGEFLAVAKYGVDLIEPEMAAKEFVMLFSPIIFDSYNVTGRD